jgi:hypothetical protein
MALVRDQYHGDPTHALLFAALEDRPAALEAVKTASFDSDAAELLPSSAFAWDDARRFPVHTREDTIASLVYRSKCAEAVPKFVDEKLAEAADAYGIDGELFVSTKVTEKVAAAAVVYAVESQKRLPLGTAEQVKLADEVLVRDSQVLPLKERIEAFSKVAAAAGAMGLSVSKDVGVYAGLNVCNTSVLRDRVGMRAARTKVAAMTGAFDALDSMFAQLPPVVTDRESLLKLASKLAELDELAGITSDYDKKIFDPMKTVFNSAEKIAEADGSMNYQKLMALPPEVWEQVDVPELGQLAQSGDIEQFKQVYDTLPMDIKMVVRSQFG